MIDDGWMRIIGSVFVTFPLRMTGSPTVRPDVSS